VPAKKGWRVFGNVLATEKAKRLVKAGALECKGHDEFPKADENKMPAMSTRSHGKCG
jgi:hypothetical protein